MGNLQPSGLPKYRRARTPQKCLSQGGRTSSGPAVGDYPAHGWVDCASHRPKSAQATSQHLAQAQVQTGSGHASARWNAPDHSQLPHKRRGWNRPRSSTLALSLGPSNSLAAIVAPDATRGTHGRPDLLCLGRHSPRLSVLARGGHLLRFPRPLTLDPSPRPGTLGRPSRRLTTKQGPACRRVGSLDLSGGRVRGSPQGLGRAGN